MGQPLLDARLRLGDLLIQRGFLTDEELQSALHEQSINGSDQLLGELIVDLGLCAEEEVLECLAVEFGVPYLRLDSRLFDSKIFETFPRDFIEKHTVLPLFKVGNVLTVAVAEPTNVFLLDQLRDLSRCEIQIAIASAKDIRRMVQTYMPNTQVFVIDDIIDDANSDCVELIEESIEDIGLGSEITDQSPVIRLVNYIIYNAVREGSSDIHIEPTERRLRVRQRLDGAMHQALDLPAHLSPAVSSRIKIMASLDISERRLPQDGRIHVMMEGRPIDLRVSTLPLRFGEKIVLRILDNRNISMTLPELGFSADVLSQFESQLGLPNGITLVTGPTGSGKSTTLYAALNAVSSMDKNICTVEDPVEFQLELVNQFQTNERIGLTFAAVLRSLLRQDPDVIMVGEIRDQETARIAIQAALTGHLVFSTLHTNDACSTVTRLLDMGVEGYLLGSSLNMVLAQRLCRRVCPRCRREYEPPKPMQMAAEELELGISEFYQGGGCKKCRHTGFSGRIAIHELMTVDEPMREIIASNPSRKAIRHAARTHGMITLRYDGMRKVREGLTTVEEVVRVSDEGWLPAAQAAGEEHGDE